MLMLVVSALFGAFLGLNSRSKFAAALVAAAMAGAAHFVMVFILQVLLSIARTPSRVQGVFSALGVDGPYLTYGMAAAASAVLVSGVLVRIANPSPKIGIHVPGSTDRRLRKPKVTVRKSVKGQDASKSLARIDDVLNG